MVRIISYLIVAGSLLLSSCHSVKNTSTQNVSTAKNKNQQGNTVSKNIPAPYEAPRKKELRKKYGAILHVPSKKIKNYRLYYFVDEWYGVRYKYGGNSKNGVDCSSLVQQLYSHVYERKTPRTSSLQYDDSRKLRKKKKLKEGDLVFFHPSGDKVSHVGVYLRNDYFFHASNAGVAISNLNETYWKNCFKAGGRIR